MKIKKKIMILMLITLVTIFIILILMFNFALKRIGEQTTACKCNKLPMTPTDKINNYCFKESLTNEEIIEYTKNYEGGNKIKSKFLQDNTNMPEEDSFSCDDWLLGNENEIVSCYCGK